jgi:peroxiredoxin
VLLILGAAWIWVSKAPAGYANSEKQSVPQVGFQAPDFTLVNAQNEQITLSDLRGQPVVVNLWASWCPPCRAEMPALQKVYEQYQTEGLQVLAVNATAQDDPDAAIAFTSQMGLTFPILFDQDGIVLQQYRLRSLPTTYFIDRQGVIQEVVIGGPMAEALLHVRIQRLLEE